MKGRIKDGLGMSKTGVYILLILVLFVLILVSLSRMWKTGGKGAKEWEVEYTVCTKRYEGLVKCIMDFDREPRWKQNDSLKRYCHL